MLPRFFRFFPTRSRPIVFRASPVLGISDFNNVVSQPRLCFAAVRKPDIFLLFLSASIHFKSMIKTLSTDVYGKALQTGAPVLPSLSPVFSVCAVWCKTSWQAPNNRPEWNDTECVCVWMPHKTERKRSMTDAQCMAPWLFVSFGVIPINSKPCATYTICSRQGEKNVCLYYETAENGHARRHKLRLRNMCECGFSIFSNHVTLQFFTM